MPEIAGRDFWRRLRPGGAGGQGGCPGMAAGRGGLRGPGARKRFRWWTAAALLVAALVVGCADDDGLDGSVAFVVDGTVVAESMSVKAALEDASERVGYPVRQPELPPGWKLEVIRTEVGPQGSDWDGIIRDLSWVKVATLALRSDDGRRVSLGQLRPEKGIAGLAAKVKPQPIETGVPGVVASVAQTPGKTTIVWDSEEASYSASYVYPDESYAADAEAFLVRLLKSMK